jgi:hypothetical protein
MPEARRVERVKSFLRAQIIFNQRMSTIECVVKNFSPQGAKIALGDSLSVPSEFELYIPQKGRSYRARLAWRDATAIGVEFVSAEAQAAEARDMAADSLETRLHTLEKQNAELKIRIRELSKRLEDLGQDPNLAA